MQKHKLRLISLYKHYGTLGAYDDKSDVYAITDDYVCDPRYWSISKEKKIALMIEPRSFLPKGYEYLEEHYEEFKYIFTFDTKLLRLPNALPIIFGTYWCSSDEKKTKGISMLCSEKELCEGHKKRKELARILNRTGKVDVKGNWNGGGYVEAIEAYRDYKFNVALENDKQDYYLTEKLCNCFANKVVPIYFGANKIDEFFDMDGVIYVENRDDIPKIIEELDIDKEYEKRKDAIERNYELVKKYRSFDDYFYTTYEKEINSLFEGR